MFPDAPHREPRLSSASKGPRLLAALLALAVLAGPAAPRVRAEELPEPRSPKAAAFLSVLVPGVGELYAGGRRSGRFFLFMEATFWTGVFTFRQLASSRRSTFQSYAAAHSGVQAAGKQNSFFDEMVRYRSIYDRNASEALRRGAEAALLPETPDFIWEWDSEASRQQFQELRSRETSARQAALMFGGALVFNRFASAINAARIARETVPAEGSGASMRMEVEPDGGGVVATVDVRF